MIYGAQTHKYTERHTPTHTHTYVMVVVQMVSWHGLEGTTNGFEFVNKVVKFNAIMITQ